MLNFMPTPQEVVIGVKFSFDLAKLLGFQGQRRYTATVTAESAPDLFSSLHSVYVYCDLVEAVLVRDTKVPLLRIVDLARKESNVHRVLNPVQYLPLQKKNFDTVEVNIMTDGGEPVPFLPGKSFIVLEFRRAVHAYFSI